MNDQNQESTNVQPNQMPQSNAEVPLVPPTETYQPQPNQTPVDTSQAFTNESVQPVQVPKKQGNLLKFSLIGVLVILSIGGGVFAAMKILNPEKSPGCENCTKPSPSPSPVQTNMISLDYAFIGLENKRENLIYSPLSIKNGLALLDAGAAEETKAEIDKVLGDAEIPKYENIEDTLSVANAVFIRDTFSENVLSNYISGVEEDYGAEVIYDDFASSTKMDDWVDKKTFGLIEQLGLAPTDDTKMVLANALAIQMDWKRPFDTDDTHGEKFYGADGEEIEVTTMKKETAAEEISYYVGDDATAVALPLESKTDEAELEFLAIMPNEVDLEEYAKGFSTERLEAVQSKLVSANTPEDGIELYIPKFKFDYGLDFKNDLKALGISQVFMVNADFSAMANKPLYVSDAIHKANIDFSEEGVKAAAVTAFMMNDGMAAGDEPQAVVVKINHPFLFVIRDRENEAVWFTGTVYQPNLWEDDVDEYRGRYNRDK